MNKKQYTVHGEQSEHRQTLAVLYVHVYVVMYRARNNTLISDPYFLALHVCINPLTRKRENWLCIL